jgi:hypothetical protein
MIKEELEELYLNQKLTMEEIGCIYKIDRTAVSYWIKKFGIKPIYYQRRFIKEKDYKLTEYQKDILIGSLLGDGSLVCRKGFPYFKVSHCEVQKDYLYWKYEALRPIARVPGKYIDKRGNSIMHQLHTLSHSGLEELKDMFYKDNKKNITDKIQLNELSLAIWFMDDGTINGNSYRFSTEGFSEEENYILKKLMEERFGFKVDVRKYRKYYYLVVDRSFSEEMTRMIGPYMIGCMRYKCIEPKKY